MPDGFSGDSFGVSAGMPAARKGRGAISNPAVRFESTARDSFDDGWGTLAELADLPPLPTTLLRERAKSAMAWNESPDIGFDRSLNPYRGCEHGCVYCYARPSHAYVGYSPGLDFETKLLFKPDLPALLEKELSRPGYVPKPVALGANTDPYQPIERTLLITRQLLEALERFGHPVTIVTKSAGVLRDLDILVRMARRNLVTEGADLNALVGRTFEIGEVVLRGIRLCEPCNYLAKTTYPETLVGLVHRGGLRAQIVRGGVLRVGDAVRPVAPGLS